MRSVCILSTLTAVLVSCASFSGSVVPEGEASDRASVGVLELHAKPPRSVRYHIVGMNRSDDIAAMQRKLEDYGLTADDAAPGLLHVIVEQQPSTSGGWRLLNLVATVLSRLLFPFYNPVHRRVEYRLYEGESLRCKFSVKTRNDEVLSVLALPLAPFFWPTHRQSKLFLESADLFAHRCL